MREPRVVFLRARRVDESRESPLKSRGVPLKKEREEERGRFRLFIEYRGEHDHQLG